MSIRVAVVDDQALVRGGFAMILGHQSDIEVVAGAGTGLEAIEVARTHRPDVILMDIRMPGMDGLEATSQIIDEADWPVRVVDPDDVRSGRVRLQGAASGGERIRTQGHSPRGASLRGADGSQRGALLAPSITSRLIGRFAERLAIDSALSHRLERLTEREQEVLTPSGRD